MMPLTPLPTLLVEPIVRQALIEDLGRAGDITTDAIAPLDCTAKTVMAARQDRTHGGGLWGRRRWNVETRHVGAC